MYTVISIFTSLIQKHLGLYFLVNKDINYCEIYRCLVRIRMGALDMRVIDLKQRQRLNKINDTMMVNETDGEQPITTQQIFL